ncbi:MAG: fused MFS/spermidine synthase [Motiliproteus sp.]
MDEVVMDDVLMKDVVMDDALMDKTGEAVRATRAQSRWMLLYLMFTALVCGGLVMVIEVLGSRMIGPFFGVSLFVWTSLITVALIALALGYVIGGQLADRHPKAGYLFAIILLSGVAVLLIPQYKLAVLEFCVPMGIRLGAFVSASILFGPSLFLLGCVSPFLVKLAATEMDNIGATVGGLYALSTLGSVIGTVLTGFVLIAYMGVNSIFHLTGVLLCVLGLSYFLIWRRLWWVAPLVIGVFFLPSVQSGEMPSVVAEDGTQATLVANHDSHYGNLKVVDYQYQDRHIREMMIDGLIQGGVDMTDGQSIYAYPYFLTLLPYALKPQIDTALVIGLGAGIVPRWLEQRGITTDVVDIDAAVFDFAERYFKVNISGKKVAQDARYFLQNSSDRYDLVVLDVFNGDTTPGHLLSLEALTLVRERLAEDGILTVNLVGDLRVSTYMTASVVRTLEQVFDQVQIYPTVDLDKTGGNGNLALIAYQGGERSADLTRLEGVDISHYARQEVLANIGKRFEFPATTPAMILTDDYNPIDVFDSSLRESVRKEILETTHWDILGYSG